MHRRSPLTLLPLIGVLLASCSSAVRVEPFEGSDTPVCRAVAAAWPVTVAGLAPRDIAVQSESVAAWGDPAVVARCGAPVPGPTTDQCFEINGVDWVARSLADEVGVAFTTYGRDPAVEVLVPDAYAAQTPLVMPEFTQAAQVVPQGDRECS